MTATYLDDIVAFHRRRVEADTREWRDRTFVQSPRRSLRDAIVAHRSQGLSVIAEVKRRSPSKGWLNEHLDPATFATEYQRGGATAISVLTDENFFAGSVTDLRAVHDSVALPILRKDFTLSANDVVDAVAMGSSAVLLIVAVLSPDELADLVEVAHGLRIDALVEVHTAQEAKLALDAGATMIGVNQRDLHTFAVDASRAREVVGELPDSVVAVAESGFHEPQSAQQAARAGFDAVLVGESLVTATQVADAVSNFVGFPIGRRGSCD